MEQPEKRHKIDTEEIVNAAMSMSCQDIENLQERLRCIENTKKEIRLKYIKHVHKFERNDAFEMVQEYPWLLNETFGWIEDGIEQSKDDGYNTWLTLELWGEGQDRWKWNPYWILKLLKAGADPNIKTMDSDGDYGNALRTYMDVLYRRIKSLNNPKHAKSHLKVAKYLLKYYVQVDPDPNDEEVSPFQMSVDMVYRNPDVEFCKELMNLLIKNGANVNHRDYNGDNVLHRIIVRDGNEQTIINLLKLLLQLGVNINEQNNDNDNNNNKTPLMYAVIVNRLNVIKFLLENRAAMDIKTADDKTAFDYCPNDECRNLFRSYSTRKWPAKWGQNEWNARNKQQYFMRDIIPKLHGYLELDDCRPENIEKIATIKFGIDTASIEWTSLSNEAKCWILKNMLSGYNYEQAKINWNAAVMQGRLNKLDFGGDDVGAYEGLGGDFIPTIDRQIYDAKKRIEEQRREAIDTNRGLFFKN